MYPKYTHRKTYAEMYLVVLFVIGPNWKQIVLYSYGRIFHSNKNDLITDLLKNMDKFQKHYVEWKKPDPKKHLLNDSICMNFIQE